MRTSRHVAPTLDSDPVPANLSATKVTILAAKTTLSKLIQRAQAGEEIVIARGDVPVARLVPIVADALAASLER